QAGARFARRRGPRWRNRHRGRHRRSERLDDRVACRGDPELSPWRQDLAASTSNLPTVVGGLRKAGLVRALSALATVTGGIVIPPGWPWPEVAPSGGGTPAALPPQTSAPTSLASAQGAPHPADAFPTFASASAANWPTAVSIDITPDFTPGVYVVLARGPDGDATAAPLVVRDDAG